MGDAGLSCTRKLLNDADTVGDHEKTER